jgi:phosphoribosylformylglycinamidine synthase
MDGNFFMEKKALTKITGQNQVLFRYCDEDGKTDEDSNPNGSLEFVAGVANQEGNVCGMMPHPERCSESILGNRDGLKIFESIITWWEKNR